MDFSDETIIEYLQIKYSENNLILDYINRYTMTSNSCYCVYKTDKGIINGVLVDYGDMIRVHRLLKIKKIKSKLYERQS